MDKKREKDFQRNANLEILLKELNGLLEPAEKEIITHYHKPKYPVIFVIGMPRGGTTLLMQWLAISGKFAYPTNLLSRFYCAPYIGAKIQKMLTNPTYNFKNEIFDFRGEITFDSQLGKTKGALAPNEFWYFWRRFLPTEELVQLDSQELKKVDRSGFLAGLAAIEAVFNKPIAMKGVLMQLNIPFLSSLFDKVLFIYIKRHPLYNMQSLLEAREKFYGSREVWYSIKPKEYDQLRKLDPFSQVAGQIYFTSLAIKEGLSQIDESRYLEISYEDFCLKPEHASNQIVDKLACQGCHVNRGYLGPKDFKNTNQIRLPAHDCEKIIEAYKKFSGEVIHP